MVSNLTKEYRKTRPIVVLANDSFFTGPLVAVIVSVAISHLNSFFDKTYLQAIKFGELAAFWSCITYNNNFK
jgi:hypothetical protein